MIVGPNDPTAMVRHTQECPDRGYPFLADPSQQLAWADGEMIRTLVDGADLLFTNEYEAALLKQKTGWSHDDVLGRVGTWVTTRAANGVRVEQRDGETIEVIAASRRPSRWSPPAAATRCAPASSPPASGAWARAGRPRSGPPWPPHAVEVSRHPGVRDLRADFLARCAATYGDEAVADFEPHLRTIRP